MTDVADAPTLSTPLITIVDSEPARGRMVDIGGRRLHLTAEGPRNTQPVIVFEAGPFGIGADWAVVQQRLAPSFRTCAYDRAGLGLSDPGDAPRDSAALVADLKALLAAADERGPYVLTAHGFSGIHAHLFALTYPELVAGLVLVDAATPESLADTRFSNHMKNAHRMSDFAPLAAKLGLMRAADPFAGDPIGLPAAAAAEKHRAFASERHNHWAALEVRDWERDAAEARTLGELSRELPVAVITTGGADARVRRLQHEPARRSRRGYAEHVETANTMNVLGARFADAVVRGIEHMARYARPQSVAA